MIDNIKIYPSDKEQFDRVIEKNKPIDLISEWNRSTGEILEYPKKGNHKNMRVRINRASSYIKGSLHKYYNMDVMGMEHNHNDFTFCQGLEAIENLCNKFYLTPEKTKITNLEFGMNLKLDSNPEIFINDNLLMYDFNQHSRHENFKGRGDYKEFKRHSYSLKLYNKSKQFDLNEHVLRIEVKITDRKKINSLGINSLADLKQKKAYYSLNTLLLEQFELLTIIDSNELKKALITNEIQTLNNYCNPNFWRALKSDVSYKVYTRHIRDFKSYGNIAGVFNTKETIKRLLKEKFYELIACETQSLQFVA
nr:hypothetical protein [uncultured Allomuricauda sp.]